MSNPTPTASAIAASITKPSDYFTFALYFSEKKSKQLCQFLNDYPFVGEEEGISGVIAPQLGDINKRIRGVKMVVDDVVAGSNDGNIDGATTIDIRFIDNKGNPVDPSLVDVLLQKASVDKDDGRDDRIAAMSAFCAIYGIRIIDPFETSLNICASRTFCAVRLAGGPAGEGLQFGRATLETLDYWGFLIPSTYVVGGDKSNRAPGIATSSTDGSPSNTITIFEEPNAPYKSDVVIIKPEVASQRDYSHDLQVMRTLDFVTAVKKAEEEGTLDALKHFVGADNGCNKWVVQDCLSLLALPTVYKVYVAGDYLSVMLYDARPFTAEIVSKVSNHEDCPPIIMKGGSKNLFKELTSLTDRRQFQDESPELHGEAVNYFAKGTSNYDDLWQTVQFLKRPENLDINFFGIDVLVIKGIDGIRDRRYIVDVNYLPSYKNEIPARLFPALLKAMLGIH